MSFIQIISNRHFVKFDTARWVEAATQHTLQRLDDHQIDTNALAHEIHSELAAISESSQGPISRPLAERVCRALGSTLAMAISDTFNPSDDGDADLLLQETIEDLDDTIDTWLEMTGPKLAGIRWSIAALGHYRLNEVADCEPYGELVVLAGTIAANVAITENP